MRRSKIIKYSQIYPSPCGPLILEATVKGIYRIRFLHPNTDTTNIHVDNGKTNNHIQRAMAWLDFYFHSEYSFTKSNPEPPFPQLFLDDQPPFYKKVYKSLLMDSSIGDTISYSQLAIKAGSPRASRAVGNAMKSNPMPILIPCHRVLSTNHGIGKYSGGEGQPTKIKLIAHEKQFKRSSKHL